MNVYSDDGLASTNNEMLWDKFMSDFKSKFDVKEKSPDYFLGAGIIQHESGAISLDPSKYLREVASSYDMSKSIHTKLPMAPGANYTCRKRMTLNVAKNRLICTNRWPGA